MQDHNLVPKGPFRIDRCDVTDTQIDIWDIAFQIRPDDAIRIGIESRLRAGLDLYSLADIGIFRCCRRIAHIERLTVFGVRLNAELFRAQPIAFGRFTYDRG